jgi:hypothetical protein
MEPCEQQMDRIEMAGLFLTAVGLISALLMAIWCLSQ